MAVHELAHEEGAVAVPPEVDDREDMRVCQPCDGPSFHLEVASECRMFGEFGRDHLDGDLAPDRWVVRPIHAAEALLAEAAAELIARELVRDRGAQVLADVGAKLRELRAESFHNELPDPFGCRKAVQLVFAEHADLDSGRIVGSEVA